MTPNDANPWQQYWGESYGPESKQLLLKPVFDKLETEEKIGNLIIDVGSGALPVTQLLKLNRHGSESASTSPLITLDR